MAGLATLVWTFLSVFGARPTEDSNTEQWVYYFYIPLFMAAASIVLLMKSLDAKPGPVGCLSTFIMALVLPYLFFYTGGM